MQLQDRRQLLISGRVAVLAAVFITSSDKRTDKNTTPTLSRSLDRGNQCARSPTIENVLLRVLAALSHKNRGARAAFALHGIAARCSVIAPDFLRYKASGMPSLEFEYSVTWITAPKVQCRYRFQRIVTTGCTAVVTMRGRRNAETVDARGVMTWSGRSCVMKIPVCVS